METAGITFEAITSAQFRAQKRRKMLVSGCLFVLACGYLAAGLFSEDTFSWIGGVAFVLLFGFRFWDDIFLRPVKIGFSDQGICMQRPESSLTVLWTEVNKCVFNGRYVDFYVQFSLRETIDLKPFSNEIRTEILAKIKEHLSVRGITVKWVGVAGDALSPHK